MESGGVLYLGRPSGGSRRLSMGGSGSFNLRESDFSEAYRTAMNVNGTAPQFSLVFLDVPKRGTLQYVPYGTNRSAVNLKQNNTGNYRFYVNVTGSAARNPARC